METRLLNHQKPVVWTRDSHRMKKKWFINSLKKWKHTALDHENKHTFKGSVFFCMWAFSCLFCSRRVFHRESLCIDTCFSAPSVYSVQTQTLYNTLLFTTVQNQQTQWISSAASSGFWQLLFQVTEEKDAHFWLFNVDLMWLNTYNVVVSSIQRNHCDSAWSSDCFWRTRRHYRV